MRGWLGIAAIVILAGCSGGGDKSPTGPTGPTTGNIQFKLDAQTCTSYFGSQTLTFTFFIDGSSVGSAALGISQNSPLYTATVGSHLASASVTNSTLHWANLNATVNAGATFTYLLLCS